MLNKSDDKILPHEIKLEGFIMHNFSQKIRC